MLPRPQTVVALVFSMAMAMVLTAVAAHAQQSPTYDVLIRNGKLVDGSGNPWIYADVGIIGDRIAFIGHADKDAPAKRIIDAKGLVVAPGFIDMLGQSERNLLIDNLAVSKITQGITTDITGEGGSIAPVNARILEASKDWSEHYKVTIDWQSLDEYFNRLEKQGSGINLGTYVGATQVRRMVLGDADRPATKEELARMCEMVNDAMLEGAMGLSTSLIYAPAFYASTDELIALAKVAQKHGGVYASHIRNEGDGENEALDEAFRIGREAKIPVEIFHLKVSGRQNWGKMRAVVAKIEQARTSGLDVTADQYPYVASATSLGAVIPPKYHEGGAEAFVARLKDPAQRAAIRAELSARDGQQQDGQAQSGAQSSTVGGGVRKKFVPEAMWRGVGGPEGVLVISVFNPELKQYEGKTIAQIALMQNKDPFDALMDLLIDDRDHVGAVYFTMNEEDVRLALQQPWVSVGTDYGEVNPTGPLGQSKSHPRAYGSFPRILGKYVREEKVLRLEEAIRKMTSLPAQREKLEQRGMIKADYFADITIFNPDTVLDVATFENPNRPSTGIEYVLVNGVLALDGGKMTGQMGGRPLRGPGYANRGVSPEGLRTKGKIQGVVTSEDGWPLPRTQVALLDAKKKTVGTAETRREGRYEIVTETPCGDCRLVVRRMGFNQEDRKVNYNGTNSLWFSFVLHPAKYQQ